MFGFFDWVWAGLSIGLINSLLLLCGICYITYGYGFMEKYGELAGVDGTIWKSRLVSDV